MNKAQDRFLRKTAWEFLLTQHINALPVDPFSLARRNGWILYTYFELSPLIGKSVAEIKKKYNHDGFVFWSEKESAFVICYNPELPMPVVRWTLVHEMAHIVLRHISREAPILNRVRGEERSLFEEEAQGFARRVLCPSIVLHACKALDVEEIMRLCGISREAALYRSEYMRTLEARGMFRTDPLEVRVEKQFLPFIVKYWKAKSDLEVAEELFPLIA